MSYLSAHKFLAFQFVEKVSTFVTKLMNTGVSKSGSSGKKWGGWNTKKGIGKVEREVGNKAISK